MSMLEDNVKTVQATSLYVKVYTNCLLPEKQENIELSEVSTKKLQSCVDKIDRNQIKNVKNVEEMFKFVLEFWSRQLFSSE